MIQPLQSFQNFCDSIIGLCFFDVRANSREKTVNDYTFFVDYRIVVSSEFWQSGDEIIDRSQPEVEHASSIRQPGINT